MCCFIQYIVLYASFCAPYIKDVNLPAIGPKLENHPLFPERTNIEFVEVLSHNKHKPLQEKQIHTRYNKLTIMD